MKEKWKLAIGITLLVIIVVIVTVVVTIQFIPASDNIEKPNPYASILEQSANYSSSVNALLNETGIALQTYYSTGNTTHLIRAGQYLTVAMNIQREYHGWYAFDVFKEIDDLSVDSQIFNDVNDLNDKILFYLMDVLIAQKTVS